MVNFTVAFKTQRQEWLPLSSFPKTLVQAVCLQGSSPAGLMCQGSRIYLEVPPRWSSSTGHSAAPRRLIQAPRLNVTSSSHWDKGAATGPDESRDHFLTPPLFFIHKTLKKNA